MAASDFFTTQPVHTGNPLRLYGLTRLAVGAVYVVAGCVTALALHPEVRSLVTALQYGGSISLRETFDGVRTLVGAALAIRGARMMNEGIGGVTRLVIPPTAPADLTPAAAEGALVRRELGAFRAPGIGLRALGTWFPSHVALLGGRMRRVVDAGLGELGRLGRLALVIAGAFVALTTFPSLNQALFAGALPSVPWTFLLVYAAAAVTHVWFTIRALPTDAPRAEVREFRGAARGGGDPSHLPHGLQRELAAIRTGDAHPNRARETGFAMQSTGVRDAGAFDGRLLVESQPRIAEVPPEPAAAPLVVVGSTVQLLALFWWLDVPQAPATLITGVNAGIAASLLYAGGLVAAALLGRIGARMVTSGAELLRRFRFESLAVLLDVRGTFARSHLRVGKGMHDSIETDNLVVRSEVYVAGYCAALLTEAREPLGERHVVGMVANDRAAEVELLVQGFLWRFERAPATVAALNFNDAGLLEVVHANLGVERERRLRGALPTSGVRPLDPPRPVDALPPVRSEDVTGETRI